MKILVCTDGQAHSGAAVQRAIHLGRTLPAEVTALLVIDPWLKKFYNELYSQGRKRYLEYVDECLRDEAEQARHQFDAQCRAQGLGGIFKVREGEPLQEILQELRESAPDLVIAGSKQMSTWGRFRSRNLPRQLEKKAGAPVSVIPPTSRPAGAPARSCS
jgi:nucleotide-binding universal stress UspA family protein